MRFGLLVSKIARTDARKGFLAIVGGTGAGQLLVVLALPVLTRFYDPAEMALYGVVIAVSAFLASFASMRLELAIPLPHDEFDSRNLLWICIGSALFTGLLVAVGLSIYPDAPKSLWPDADLGAWVYPTAIMTVLIAVNSALVQMTIRLRRYSVIGRLSLLQSGTTVSSQLVLSSAAVAPQGGLVWGAIIGRSVGLSMLVRTIRLDVVEVPRPAVVVRLLRQYWRFPVIFAPTAGINVLGLQLTMLIFPSRYGVAAAGMYALATRVAAIPGSLVGGAAQQVYVGELARTASGRPAEALFLRWSRVLAAVGLCAGLAFWFVLPDVVGWLFGAQWAPAGPYIAYLGVMASFGVVGSALQGTWTVYQSAIASVVWDVFRLCALWGALWLALTRDAKPEDAVALVSLAGVISYICGWLHCWMTVRFRERPQDRAPAMR